MKSRLMVGINRLAAGIITNIIIIKGRFAFESFLFGRLICRDGPTQEHVPSSEKKWIQSLKTKNRTWKKKIYSPRKPQKHSQAK